MKIFLVKSEDHDVKIDEAQLVDNLESANLVWFHNAFNPELLKAIFGKVPMIFYGEAAKAMSQLIEGQDLTNGCQILRSEDPWDKRGFQAYRHHQLFEGLNGGFYSYLVTFDSDEKIFYYSGSSARVVAVEKRYISVVKNKPVIWEYEYEDKKILCIGGYLNFKSPNIKYCLAEAEIFVKNVIRYMTTEVLQSNSWPVCENSTQMNRDLPMVKLSLKPLTERVDDSGLLIHQGVGTDYTNLCGRRILVNLRENGIFDEVWIHPFRFLKGINFSVDGQKLGESYVHHKIYADRVVHENDLLKLVSFVSLDKPLAMFQLEFKDGLEHEVKVDFESDTRIMWPFDDDYNCGRSFNYDDREGCITVQTNDGMFRGYIKTNCPIETAWTKSEESLKVQISMSVSKILSVCLGGFVESEEIPREVDFTQELRNYNLFVNKYLDETLQIETNHPVLDKMFQYAKLGTVKFVVSVPGVGEGLMAGYANSRQGWFSARPGYAWYFGRDSEWVSLALLGVGDWITVRKNLELLTRYQRADGKIFHELTSSGVVHYDAADSTPLFLLVFHRYWKHTNDWEFLKRHWINVVKAFEFCFSTDQDQDGLIENTVEGHGWIEGGKLYGSHAELYLNAIWLAAVRSVLDMANFMKDQERVDTAKQLLPKIESAIRNFYDEDTGFYILGVLKSGEKLRYLTVMTAVAVYLDSIDFEECKHQVLPYGTNDFSTDWGVRIIGKSSGMYNPKGYHEGTIWPLFTGWVSLAEFKVGASLSGFSHLLSNLLNAKYFAKGYISEVYHGEVYQPSGICPHQAWSESMAIQPLIEGMLGFVPDAPNDSVSLSPQFPWNINRFKVKNLRVGEVSMDLHFERHRLSKKLYKDVYQLRCTNPLKVRFSFWIPKQAEKIEVVTEDSKVTFDAIEGIFARRINIPESQSNEMTVTVIYELPFELYGIEKDPVPLATSGHFRLISLNKVEDEYEILAEASSVEDLVKDLPKVLKVGDERFNFGINEVGGREVKVFSITVRRFER